MNRPDGPGFRGAARPPRRRRLWLWMAIVVVLAAVFFAAIFAFPIVAFVSKGFPVPPPAAVTTATARFEEGHPEIQIVGSLKPVRGADLSVEVSGIGNESNFDSGGDVAAGGSSSPPRDSGH